MAGIVDMKPLSEWFASQLSALLPIDLSNPPIKQGDKLSGYLHLIFTAIRSSVTPWQQ